MNILVVGCSKVGARLALDLSRHGHDVFVVDRDEMALEALPENFKGENRCRRGRGATDGAARGILSF